MSRCAVLESSSGRPGHESECLQQSAGRYSWHALHVKSRHEFVTERDLEQKGIETFLPTIMKMNQWKDRKKLIEYPMFPGYVFVYTQANSEHHLEVLKTRGVVAFVCLEPGIPTLVSSDEMETLQRMIASGREIDLFPHLSQGACVRIKSGPLKGAAGILNRKCEEYSFMINVELLGRSVAVKISPYELETA